MVTLSGVVEDIHTFVAIFNEYISFSDRTEILYLAF